MTSVPLQRSFNLLSVRAAPTNDVMWISCPQACITPTSRPWAFFVVTPLAYGRPVFSTTGSASMSARTITVGERTGNLEDILRQLATYMDKEQALVRKLRDALTYPVFVVMVAIGVVVLMLTTALPPMVSLFESFATELPLPTRILIASSKFATGYGIYVLFGGLIVGVVVTFVGVYGLPWLKLPTLFGIFILTLIVRPQGLLGWK